VAEKTIAVIGGGIGGLVAARQLRTLLGAKHRIVLIDKTLHHQFPPLYLWTLLGWRTPMDAKKPLSILKRFNIRYLNALVHAIHCTQNVIQTNKEIIWYDYLIVALGSEPSYSEVPGLSLATPNFSTLESAEHLHQRLRQFTSGTIAILIGGLPHRYPPAAYEAALLLDYYYRNLGRKNITLEIYTPEPSPLSSMGKDIGPPMLEVLQKRGIKFHPLHTISDIQGGKNEILFQNGTTINPDIFMVVPPVKPPLIIRESGLAGTNDWITVDLRTLRTVFPNVYAIGDNISPQLADGSFLPKTGILTTRQADVVANNLAFALESKGKIKQFSAHGHSFIEAGNGTAGIIRGKYYERPSPIVSMHKPSMSVHWRKLLYEKYWWFRWF